MTGQPIEGVINEENENSPTNSPQLSSRGQRSRFQVGFHERPLTIEEKEDIQKMNDDFQEGEDEPIPTDSEYYGGENSEKDMTERRTV
eukprot:CAMPEP_0170498334 /NCGR_PEP_ID=MMETSP0208-20121228/27498_1 /TAXON_ID=197538 /ORGANISM="Strombidium inclinatum, Strain S3" /LENGTH=87 /DNA_ID=CAMNT_0010775473 /DNA_START=1515 /DNA_END=1778 /DNA_ORIENTATION=-